MTVQGGEDHLAWIELQLPLGLPGSGRQRYAAAMHLYRRGLLSADILEAYRVCSPKDWEDPDLLLAARRIRPVEKVAVPADRAIARLIEEIDRYLSGFSGVGVAEVRGRIARWSGGGVRPKPGKGNPVVDANLGPALSALEQTHPALADAISVASPHLSWITYGEYPPDEIGAAFLSGHAFASLIGGGAPIHAAEFDLGLFIIAPDVLSRDHAHPAPELYAPLTGPHGWRFGPETPLVIKPAHVPVWNRPHAPHMTKVGPVPFLCIFGWTQDVDLPAYVLPARDWAGLESLKIGERDGS